MAKPIYRSALTLACVALLGACSESGTQSAADQSGSDPSMPKAKNFLVPPMQVPEFAGWAQGAAPTVAPGLKIEKIASDLKHPRQLLTLPNGDVLVVESNGPGEEAVTTPKQLIAGMVKNKSGKGAKGGNQITLLRKTGNGEWEKHTFIEHLHSPFGVQLIGNTLYVANTGEILSFPYTEGETEIKTPGVEFTDLPSTVNHHWTKALQANPEGTKLYVGVGSNSNITENGMEVEYRRANVLEVDVASRSSRIYASGIRNPTGLQWDPTTNKLWAIANERDEIGADLVPDYMTSVTEGAFYGWPYSYYGQNVDTRVMPQRPDMVQKAIKPDYALGSHVAALGLLLSQKNALPAKYQTGAFVSEHGSWDRSPLSGYAVVFVAFQDGKPVGKPETLVSGFYSKDEKQLYGAPVGVVFDKDGALLIADDVGNTVWRVSSATP
ncbi:sorbosone dehydrogenase family protein [Luteibacter aegosomaticola]|uniref:PQQ-dependent sugar dehydrogenase n=1 Tax=Luteibacter aegosomaticola TaxID=2911538 RepID=UPI001FF70841|nr:sorbosone dehydrogenase family protein [Luteibacter aegosomaticola]UPG92144.1 sorbosone dehydrogenase family protein [Luteibacter aegosomaticola]